METTQIERRKRGFFGWTFLVIFWLFNAFMLFSCVAGMSSVSTTYDSLDSSAEKAGAAIGTTLGLGMIFFVWAAGAVVLGVLVLATRGPKIITTVDAATPGTVETAAEAAVNGPNPFFARIPWWGWAIGVAVLALLFWPRSPSPDTPATQTVAIAATDAAPSPPVAATVHEPPTPTSRWAYQSDQDRMRESVDRFATNVSLNTVNMGFPYDDVQMSIMLRKSAQYGRDIILVLNEGQFHCRYDGCSISAKFDDGPIQTFSVNESDSGTNGALFIQNKTRFLGALRSSRRVMIEARFFNHGAQQFEFDVAGLEWEQP